MIIGILVGLLCLGVTLTVYLNRDELKGRPQGLELALYLAAVAVSIAIGVSIIVITTTQQDVCGGPDVGYSACN